ncbi:MAG: DUF928 domain-containing protein [Coleofasciculus sp. Co-bin14]|nr:DUF928 domain-containing protein [Coleofasciculus sp. Co-bin14]
MGYQKFLSSVGAFAVAICVGVELVAFSFVASQLRAQSLKVSVTFPPADKSRRGPARTVGAGGRSTTRSGPGRESGSLMQHSCLASNEPAVAGLTAMAPSNNVATTVSANPTLFWYVPRTKAKSARLIILDNQTKKFVYQTTLPLQDAPSVMKLSLPKSVSLEPGKDYLWNLFLICNPARPQDDMLLQGVIERTELTAEQKTQLAQATDPLKQAEIYAKAEIWQETLTLLAQLRQERPNDPVVTEAWQELLESVELTEIATEPLMECCKVKDSPQ